jgi:hypothetical protein
MMMSQNIGRIQTFSKVETKFLLDMAGFTDFFPSPTLVTIQAITMIGAIDCRHGQGCIFCFTYMTIGTGFINAFGTVVMAGVATPTHGCHLSMELVIKKDWFENIFQQSNLNCIRDVVCLHLSLATHESSHYKEKKRSHSDSHVGCPFIFQVLDEQLP